MNVTENIRIEIAANSERPEVAMARLRQELDRPPANARRSSSRAPQSFVTQQLEDLMRAG